MLFLGSSTTKISESSPSSRRIAIPLESLHSSRFIPGGMVWTLSLGTPMEIRNEASELVAAMIAELRAKTLKIQDGKPCGRSAMLTNGVTTRRFPDWSQAFAASQLVG